MVVADIDEDGGHETVALVEAAGGQATFVRTDVSSPAEVAAMVHHAVDTYGGLDCAHNNAGIAAPLAPLADYPDDGWDRTIAVMLTGVYHCMKAEIPAMLERGGGAIVNTASGVGLVAYPDQAAYTASKHGVIGLTKVAALDYGAPGHPGQRHLPGHGPHPDGGRGHPARPVHRRPPARPAPHRPHRRGVRGGRGRGVAVHPGGLVRARRGPPRRRRVRGPVRTTATSATVTGWPPRAT